MSIGVSQTNGFIEPPKATYAQQERQDGNLDGCDGLSITDVPAQIAQRDDEVNK